MDLRLTLPVRQFIEEISLSGSIDFRQPDISRAMEGIQGHKNVQSNRPENFQAEYSVSGSLFSASGSLELILDGRIDGLQENGSHVIIEEIKTCRSLPFCFSQNKELTPEDFPLSHRLQLFCYAALLFSDYDTIEAKLTYYDMENERSALFAVDTDFLARYFYPYFEDWCSFQEQYAKRIEKRNNSLKKLEFPLGDFRAGQRDLAAAVYRAASQCEHTMIQAPTGIGKTIGTLYPALKALGDNKADKIIYLSARGTGRETAIQASRQCAEAGADIQVVAITAKEKACPMPEVTCTPEYCPYAYGYYDRLRPALAELRSHSILGQEELQSYARQNTLCPFELSLDIALEADIIIGDYNYFFDPRVSLKRLFEINKERKLLLCDESHNLPSRVRNMYTARLDKRLIMDARKELKTSHKKLYTSLGTMNSYLLELRKSTPSSWSIKRQTDEEWLHLLKEFISACDQENRMGNSLPGIALQLYFDCLFYRRIAECFNSAYKKTIEIKGKSNVILTLNCIDPAPFIEERLKRVHSANFFSATLIPDVFFKRLIFNNREIAYYDLPSPFPPEHCGIIIHTGIRTNYKNRSQDVPILAEAIIKTEEAYPGNYLIFFPSYAYMESVAQHIHIAFPDQEILMQTKNMDDAERTAYINAFNEDGKVLGFAVSGGIFGEGIDLPGKQLEGVIVVGVSLPAISPENDLIRDYFDFEYHPGSGFDYAYRYPGFNRIAQAAGRLIRSEKDKGIIQLIDQRFDSSFYRNIYPAHWQNMTYISDNNEIKDLLESFAAGNTDIQSITPDE